MLSATQSVFALNTVESKYGHFVVGQEEPEKAGPADAVDLTPSDQAKLESVVSGDSATSSCAQRPSTPEQFFNEFKYHLKEEVHFLDTSTSEYDRARLTGIRAALNDYLNGSPLKRKLEDSPWAEYYSSLLGSGIPALEVGFYQGFFVCGLGHISDFENVSFTEEETRFWVQEAMNWIDEEVTAIESQTHSSHLLSVDDMTWYSEAPEG